MWASRDRISKRKGRNGKLVNEEDRRRHTGCTDELANVPSSALGCFAGMDLSFFFFDLSIIVCSVV